MRNCLDQETVGSLRAIVIRQLTDTQANILVSIENRFQKAGEEAVPRPLNNCLVPQFDPVSDKGCSTKLQRPPTG